MTLERNLAARRKRLRFRCWHRGSREAGSPARPLRRFASRRLRRRTDRPLRAPSRLRRPRHMGLGGARRGGARRPGHRRIGVAARQRRRGARRAAVSGLAALLAAPGERTVSGALEGRDALAVAQLHAAAPQRDLVYILCDDARLARTAAALALFAPRHAARGSAGVGLSALRPGIAARGRGGGAPALPEHARRRGQGGPGKRGAWC